MARYVQTKPETLLNISRIVTIHYNEVGPNFVFSGEKHDFWEAVYVDKGRVRIQRDSEQIDLEQGQILFHKPNEFHSIRALDSSPNFFVISFVCHSAAMSLFERYCTRLDKTQRQYLNSIIKEAEKTYKVPKNDLEMGKLERRENAPIGGEQLIKTYLEQMLIFLLRAVMKQTQTYTLPAEEEGDPLVNAICTYLDDRVEERVRIEDLCGAFGYSRSYLSRLFQRQTGETLAGYAVKQKIRRAKQLIRETNMNFAQISAGLAFENPQYFSRVFKRCTGMTPTEFKNRAHV